MDELAYSSALEQSLALGDDLQSAISVWERFVLQHQACGMAFFNLANLQYARDNEHSESAVNYARACELEPEIAELRLEFASALQSKGNYSEAVKQCDHAIRLAPDSLDGYQRRGLAQYFAQNHHESQADFAKVLEIDPLNGFARLRRSINFADCSKLQESFDELTAFDSTNGESARLAVTEIETLRSNAFLHLAGHCIESRDSELTDRVFTCFANGAATSEDFGLAFFLIEKHFDYDHAIRYFERGVENGVSVTGETGFGVSTRAIATGRRQDAILILETALKTEPNHLKCLQQLGWWYFEAGDMNAAEKTLRHSVEISPDEAGPTLRLAWILASKTDSASNAEALGLAHQLSELPGEPEHKKLKVLAKCQIVTGQVNEGRINFDRVLQLSPDEDMAALREILDENA